MKQPQEAAASPLVATAAAKPAELDISGRTKLARPPPPPPPPLHPERPLKSAQVPDDASPISPHTTSDLTHSRINRSGDKIANILPSTSNIRRRTSASAAALPSSRHRSYVRGHLLPINEPAGATNPQPQRVGRGLRVGAIGGGGGGGGRGGGNRGGRPGGLERASLVNRLRSRAGMNSSLSCLNESILCVRDSLHHVYTLRRLVIC